MRATLDLVVSHVTADHVTARPLIYWAATGTLHTTRFVGKHPVGSLQADTTRDKEFQFLARRSKAKRESEKTAGGPTTLRIIGGHFRGRKLAYHGELHTRPMKERVREALFNLVGPSIKGSHVIDLFAGTGALGLEAISRGAVSATFIERHFPTADIIEQNIAGLDVADRCHVVSANTFLWIRDAPKLPPDPWLVLCSPPFDFFVDQVDAMITLVQFFLDRAAPGSQLLVEADNRFDFEQLPQAADWDVRTYSPAVLGLLRVGQ